MSAGFSEEWRSDGVEKSRPANLSMQPVYYEWLYQSVCNLISWDIILCRRNNFRVVVYQGSTRKLVKCAPTIVVYVKDENVTSTHSLRTRTKKISNKFIAMMCVRCCKRTIILETASIYVSHFNYAHMEYYHFSLVYFFSSSPSSSFTTVIYEFLWHCMLEIWFISNEKPFMKTTNDEQNNNNKN